MKLKYAFDIAKLGDEVYAVPIRNDPADFKGVLKLNSSAVSIVKLLREETTVEQLVSSLMEEYDASREELTPHVERILQMLRDENLLIE